MTKYLAYFSAPECNGGMPTFYPFFDNLDDAKQFCENHLKDDLAENIPGESIDEWVKDDYSPNTLILGDWGYCITKLEIN